MERYTVMIIPEQSHAGVRRFSVPRDRVKKLVIAVGVFLLAVALMSVDYVRARLDTRELAGLRAETAAQRSELETLNTSVGELQERLARLKELERKVRIIADLPSVSEAAQAPPAGVGGGGEEEDLPEIAPEGAADAPAPQPPGQAPAPQARLAPDLPRAVVVARLHADAQQLNARAAARERSLAELVDQLRGKSRRLASTPSIWPTKGWVTSGYGHRTSPFTGQRQFHGGVDVAGQVGTPIVAPARGRVVSAGRRGPLGRAVVLDHGYGIRTYYGHTHEIFVKPGQEVQRGQEIATMGNTGRSTGPHLHYAVKVDGRLVNPMDYILE